MLFRSINLFLFFLAISMSFWGCKKDDPIEIDMGYDYYPLDIGHWIVYEVDSISYRKLSELEVESDTSHYQLKEVVESTYIDIEGRETYRIEVFKRANENAPWVIHRVWSLNLLSSNLQKVEDDLRYIKLVFAVEEGKSWKGNVYILAEEETDYLSDWTYKMEDVGNPIQLNSMTFDSSLKVVQVADSNLIEKTVSLEYFAKDVGMIYKELQVLKKQNVLNDWDQPEEGFILKQRIVDYQM